MGHRILFVDDAPATHRLALAMRAVGYRVTAVPTVELALDQIETTSVDAVVSSADLLGLDGYELTKRLRQGHDTRELPILLISAHLETWRRVVGMNVGADDFLTRPVDPDELIARVEARLSRSLRQRDLERRSTCDPLTGLLNRRALEDEVSRELKRMARTGLPASLVMVDVDRFKEINDVHGHLVGDEALRRVGNKLVATVRATDRVARFGGDEFVVLLPDTNEVQANELVERMRRMWRQHPPLVPLAAKPILASFGGATAQPGRTIETLVHAADVEMYRHKRRRRSSGLTRRSRLPTGPGILDDGRHRR